MSASASERVLILAPRGRDAAVARQVLREAGIASEAVATAHDLAARMDDATGAALLTLEALTPDTAPLLISRFAAQPPWSDLPVLLLGDRNAPDRHAQRVQDEFQRAANLVLLERPLLRSTLLSSVRVALRARRRQYEVRDFSATLESAVRDRTASLEEVVRTLGAFTYTVAHDLRAPIRTIHRYAELLLEEGAEESERRDYARSIARAAFGMDELIQALLGYSRLRRDQMRMAGLALEPLVSDAVARLEDDDVRRRVRARGPFPRVRGDETMISQILHNLLSNALKFVAPGVEARVVVRAETLDGRVRIWVEDNGIGIEPAFREKAFEVFERLEAKGRYPGTGIGLAIVRKAAELMGGRCGVEANEGGGSRFWVDLLPEGAA